MEQATLPVLAAWESFYVIIGSAAAALTGLQFVATVLGADMHRGSEETNRAFATPTVIHFSTVLLIAATLSAPWPALWGVALALGLCGIIGVIYMALVLRTALWQTMYKPVLEDWICHFSLPPIAYATLLVAAITLQRNPTLSLFVVAGAALLLLFVGIHNAWDAVTFIALNLRYEPEDAKK